MPANISHQSKMPPAPPSRPPSQTSGAKSNVAVVGLHNAFYDDNYYFLLILFILLLSICGGGVLWGLYELEQQPKPQIFATTPDGKLVAPVPLTKPGLTEPALLEWVVEAATSAYSFNFVNYEQAILSTSKNFTKIGYQDYRKALIDSNMIDLVITRKFVVSATPTSAPLVIKEKPAPDGTYAWQVQLPILVTLQSSKELINRYLVLTMLIMRVPMTDSTQGVAIAAMIVRAGKG